MPAGPLIDADTLAAELGESADAAVHPLLLDVRWDLARGPRPDHYAQGHIPGAAFVDLDRDLAAPPGDGRRGRHPLPERAAFAAAMRAVGVSATRPVVVYDDAGATTAARAWWLLRHHGHPAVAVLDGGLTAWRAAGHRLATGPSAPPAPGDFAGVPGRTPILDAGSAAALARDRRGALLDARAPERFRGDTEPVDPVAGHIPGARNRPTTANLAADGRFHDPETLRAAFAALGVTADRAVGAYCGSGVTAAHEVLALELAGIRAALYPGSWSEWCADPGRPVETGGTGGTGGTAALG